MEQHVDTYSPSGRPLRHTKIAVLLLAFALICGVHAYYYFLRGLPVGKDLVAWLLAVGGATALVEASFRLFRREQASLTHEIELCKQADARREDEQERLRRFNRALARISGAPLLYGGNLSAALDQVTETSAHTLEVERVGVWLFVEERTKIRCLNLYERGANRHTSGHELEASRYPAY
ncbi:MAG: hypothetical protein ONB15_09610, partial [candidate division KSB1 bacterium]|nr:hypothetical protein [candidate division KSB1 bacterium]